jgi:transposase
VVSGIIYVIRNGLRWRDAPAVYDPHKTLYKPVRSLVPHWVSSTESSDLAAESGPPDRVMIDGTHLKSHRTAASLLKKENSPRLIGRTKGGLNSKLHAVCDGAGRPVIFLLTGGQMSDHKGTAVIYSMLPDAETIYSMLPDAETLIADKGYDSGAFREALAGRGITPCIPPRAKRRLPATYFKTLYR